MKRKVLLSAAALVLGTANLFGLGQVSAQDAVTLDFSALESAYGSEVWQEIVDAYKEVNPNVTINLQVEKNLEDILAAQLQAGEAPDGVLLAGNRTLTTTVIKDQGLTDLTDVLDVTIPGEEVAVKDKLLDGMTASTSTNPYRDGKTYLLPMFYSPTGLFYNKALFEEKGWEVPATWDQMFELGEKAKEEGISLFTYPTAGYLDTFFNSTFYNAGGQEFFDKITAYDGETWESDQVKNIFDILGRLAENTEPTTVANANKDNFTKNQQLLLDNKALFMPNGTWVVDEMAEAPRAEGFEWAMTALPTVEEGSDRYAYTFLEHVWIPEAADQKDAAKEFIAFLYSDKAAEIFAGHGAIQPIKGLVEKLPEDKQLFYGIYDQGVKAGMGNYVATEPIEGLTFNDVMYAAFDSVVSGDLTADDWRTQAIEAMAQFHEMIIE